MVIYLKIERWNVVMGIKSRVYHDAKIQALWERNQKQDEACLEMLGLLAMLGILALLTFC